MHHLYIVVLTRFHAFSSKEILYLYSKIHITKYRVKLVVLLYLKALPVHERRCDVQMTIALFVVTIIICPVLTGIIANYLYDPIQMIKEDPHKALDGCGGF
jgi:hypothetical protein